MSEAIYLIWSEEHQAWWRPGRNGYTRSLVAAGLYTKEDADAIVENANKYLTGGQFNEIALLIPPVTKTETKKDE